MPARIYLDYAATAPLLPEVRRAMLPWLDAGNASSLHAEGRRARAAIDSAREKVARAVGCDFAEVVFTSGGTEAMNLAVIGTVLANEDARRHRVLLSAAEHHCALTTLPTLERLGYTVEIVPVDRVGRAVLPSLDERVLLVAAMAVNNELGTLNDIRALSKSCDQVGARLVVDCVQALGKSDLPTQGLRTFSAHKIGGPKGIGAMVLPAGLRVKPLISGGGQEREIRGGTENVAAIVGFGAALDAMQPVDSAPAARFRSLLVEMGFVPTVAEPGCAIPAIVHGRFPGLGAETLLISLDRAGIAAGSGAACSSGSVEPSHVMLACGYSIDEAKEALRFSFGRGNSITDAEDAAGRVRDVVRRIGRLH